MKLIFEVTEQSKAFRMLSPQVNWVINFAPEGNITMRLVEIVHDEQVANNFEEWNW